VICEPVIWCFLLGACELINILVCKGKTADVTLKRLGANRLGDQTSGICESLPYRTIARGSFKWTRTVISARYEVKLCIGFRWISVLKEVVPWLRWFVADIWPWRPGFDPASVRLRFVGMEFSPSTSVFPCQCHSTNAPYWSSSTCCFCGSRGTLNRKLLSLFLLHQSWKDFIRSNIPGCGQIPDCTSDCVTAVLSLFPNYTSIRRYIVRADEILVKASTNNKCSM
jgi:hypothetical protein